MALTTDDARIVADAVWGRDVDSNPDVTQAAYRALDAAQKAAEKAQIASEAARDGVNEIKALLQASAPAVLPSAVSITGGVVTWGE